MIDCCCCILGSQNSLDKSIDEVSSLGGVGGSRVSLANTSVTSGADLSTWSSTKKFDSDSLQSARSLITGTIPEIDSVGQPTKPHKELKLRCSSTTQSPSESPKKALDRYSTHSEGGDQYHNGGFESPSHSPRLNARPSRLSVSQTTLRESDNNMLLSEPATPKATETPDTVRIFVPYSPNTTTDGETTLVPSSHSSSVREMSSTMIFLTPYNGGDIETSPALGGCDPYRIKIQVDGDSSYSDLPSPIELTSSIKDTTFSSSQSQSPILDSDSTPFNPSNPSLIESNFETSESRITSFSTNVSRTYTQIINFSGSSASSSGGSHDEGVVSFVEDSIHINKSTQEHMKTSKSTQENIRTSKSIQEKQQHWSSKETRHSVPLEIPNCKEGLL